MDKDHLEILPGDILGKFDLVLEGHDALHKRIDNVYQKLDEKIDLSTFKLEAKMEGVEAQLEKKIDAVATDLAAHRRDTEAHPSVYKVKENK